MRVQTGVDELPGAAAVLAQTEAGGRGDQHDLGARRVCQDLVHVALDVERRRPGLAAVARARDTAHVDVDVNGAVGRAGDRPGIGGIAPRRVPCVATLDRLERLDRREPIGAQPEQMRLLGPDQQPGRRRRYARRLRLLDRGSLRPGGVGAFPERPAADDGPGARAVHRERRQGSPGQRLYRTHLIPVQLPEPAAGPHADPRRHARDDTRSRYEMRGLEDRSRLEIEESRYNPGRLILSPGEGTMTTEQWFDSLTAELLEQNPFRRSEYFKRFASGRLSREQVWGHIAQHYLLIAWFPRIFSGIHTRCDDFEVRKDCARHLLVEDLGYLSGQVGATPDHDELFRRIGDDLGYPRDAYDRIAAIPEMAAIVNFFQQLAHDRPWSAALCATALLEEEVVEIARTVGRALVQHYGVRPEWGGQNYTVHEAVEQEESGETKKTILKYLRTPDDRRAAEDAMREMHRLLQVYAEGLARRHLS
ncbi:MAG: hypothetical protein DMD99_15960 [Candidatus Rokuibacteriota bacterium]|nr:MAG: hypothetical protein DMD99_15960 [Candidatus Rokubacteria bacterium]